MQKHVLKNLITVVIILVCIAAIQWARHFLSLQQDDPLRMVSARIKGNPKAPIKIVEYIDFRCRPCGAGTRWLKGFMSTHPDKILLEVRYFPIHLTHGAITARLAQCALKQKKFWEVHDALFETQRQWLRLANAEKFFLDMVKEKGLDAEDMEACLQDPKVYDEVMEIKHQGKEMGVSATPTYFINGTMVVGGKNLVEELARILNIKPDYTIPHE